MMKFMEKPVFVDAEPYVSGMEDGFCCMPFSSSCNYKNHKNEYKQCDECCDPIPKKPFIYVTDGREYINEGDFIITESDGNKYVCDKHSFYSHFEPIV